jgi:signal transduction histidine kinase
LYRIALEALNNALKHAAATSVTVSLHVNDEQLSLAIRDNGLGFEPAQIQNGGLGLVSMRERARQLGGVLTVCSMPGNGTTVEVAVPYRRERS